MNRKALVLILLGLSSCKTTPSSRLNAESPKKALNLNDVSILFPLVKIPALLQTLPKASDKPDPARFASGQKAAPLDDQSFVPAWARQEIDAILSENNVHIQAEFDKRNGGGTDDFPITTGFVVLREKTMASNEEGSNFNDAPFRLVSLRIDPCANLIDAKGKDESCVRQIRLIFQRFSEKRAGTDSNIHAVYRLDRSEFQEVVATLRTLSAASPVDNGQVPLQVHPTILAEGAEGPYYKGVLGIVHRYARASKLTNVAFLGDTAAGLQGHWPMLQFGVEGGKSLRSAIPATKHFPSVPLFNAVQRMEGHGISLEDPIPASSSKIGLYPQNGESLTDFAATKFRNSYLIENPRQQDALRLDCASCHTAFAQKHDAFRLLKRGGGSIELPSGAFASKSFNLDNTSGKAVDEGWKNVRDFDATSLQMFSYFRSEPKVAQRTINESAVVAEYINQRY